MNSERASKIEVHSRIALACEPVVDVASLALVFNVFHVISTLLKWAD